MRWMLLLLLLVVACAAAPTTVCNDPISPRCGTVRALVISYQADTNMTPHSRALNVWGTIRYNAECFTQGEVIKAIDEVLRCERELDRQSQLHPL